MVATSSLELGIDIGEIELVCQLGLPHSIASFLQRVGRSGHSVGGMPLPNGTHYRGVSAKMTRRSGSPF